MNLSSAAFVSSTPSLDLESFGNVTKGHLDLQEWPLRYLGMREGVLGWHSYVQIHCSSRRLKLAEDMGKTGQLERFIKVFVVPGPCLWREKGRATMEWVCADRQPAPVEESTGVGSIL